LIDPLYKDYNDLLEQMEMAREKLNISRQLLLQKEVLDRQIGEVEAANQTFRIFNVQRRDHIVVGAQMQEIMNGICTKNGADIRQTRVLKVDELGPYKEIFINTDLISTVSGLSKIIFELEHSNYLFMITEISMNNSSRRTVDDVRTRMTVVGLMREEKSK